jgi:hypothetical protein
MKGTPMIPYEEQLFSYSDLVAIVPWLSEETCRQLTQAGLFTPRIVRQETDSEIPCMYVYDFIALTAMQQLLRCGTSQTQLRKALYDTSSFRCDDFSNGDLIFLSTGCLHGQELSRFLEITNANVTVLVRVPLDGEPEIEFISNELLDTRDYKGVTLTGVDCKAIRDLIEANIASANPLTASHQADE